MPKLQTQQRAGGRIAVEYQPLPALLRWAGSKRSLLPALLKHLPANFSRYVEPFVGSACLFFALRPKRAVLGDVNRELIETYGTIQAHPKLVARASAAMPKTRRFYYQLRSGLQDMEDPIQKAARFIYLNRHCFNGLYRTNLAGQFNVPRGCKTGNVPQEEVFWRCSRALRSATLLAADFEETMNHVRANDFVYLDPPYHVTNRRVFRDYIPGSFGAADLQRLSLALNAVHSVGAKFLLSYADCSDARSLFGGWHVRRITVARNIAGFAGNRKRAVELMVSNYIACPG